MMFLRLCSARLLIVAVIFPLPACTEATFVDPFATARRALVPTRAAATISSQEGVLFLEWAFPAAAPLESLTFESRPSPDAAWKPLNVSESLYDPFPQSCANRASRCLRLVVPGDTIPIVRALHPDLGPLAWPTPTASSWDKTFTASPRFAIGNDSVATRESESRALIAKRTFEWGLIPIAAERDCTPTLFDSFDRWRLVTDERNDVARTDDGLYCHALRPRGHRLGRGAILTTPIVSAPELVLLAQTYTPPFADNPLVVKWFHDEQLGASCEPTRALFDNALGNLSFTRLPAILLSGAECRISGDRRFDPDATVSEFSTALAALGPVREKDALILYSSNVWSGGPHESLGALRSGVASLAGTRALVWAVSTIPVATADREINWNRSASEISADLSRAVAEEFPTVSQYFETREPVPLLGDVAREHAGRRLKLCDGSYPRLVPEPSLANRPIDGAAPPTARVAQRIARSRVPKPAFAPTTIRFRVQVCTRYCDHAAPPSYPSPWLTSARCFE